MCVTDVVWRFSTATAEALAAVGGEHFAPARVRCTIQRLFPFYHPTAYADFAPSTAALRYLNAFSLILCHSRALPPRLSTIRAYIYAGGIRNRRCGATSPPFLPFLFCRSNAFVCALPHPTTLNGWCTHFFPSVFSLHGSNAPILSAC